MRWCDHFLSFSISSIDREKNHRSSTKTKYNKYVIKVRSTQKHDKIKNTAKSGAKSTKYAQQQSIHGSAHAVERDRGRHPLDGVVRSLQRPLTSGRQSDADQRRRLGTDAINAECEHQLTQRVRRLTGASGSQQGAQQRPGAEAGRSAGAGSSSAAPAAAAAAGRCTSGRQLSRAGRQG